MSIDGRDNSRSRLTPDSRRLSCLLNFHQLSLSFDGALAHWIRYLVSIWLLFLALFFLFSSLTCGKVRFALCVLCPWGCFNSSYAFLLVHPRKNIKGYKYCYNTNVCSKYASGHLENGIWSSHTFGFLDHKFKLFWMRIRAQRKNV